MKINIWLNIAAIFLLGLTLACSGSKGDDSGNQASSEISLSAYQVQEDAVDRFNTFLAAARTEREAYRQTVQWLQDQPQVSQALYDETADLICVKYQNGLIGTINLSPLPFTGQAIDLSSQPARLSQRIISPPGRNALFLMPLGILDGFDIRDVVAEKLLEAGFAIEIKGPLLATRQNTAAREAFADLDQYDVVYINAHGNYLNNSIIPGTLYLRTGEEVMDFDDLTLWEMIQSDLRYRMFIETDKDKKNWWCLSDAYFVDQYEDRNFSNSLVYLDVCHSFDADGFANAFVDNGAGVFFGWENVTCSCVIGTPLTTIFDALLQGETALTGYNLVRDRFPMLCDQTCNVDPPPSYTTLKMQTKNNEDFVLIAATEDEDETPPTTEPLPEPGNGQIEEFTIQTVAGYGVNTTVAGIVFDGSNFLIYDTFYFYKYPLDFSTVIDHGSNLVGIAADATGAMAFDGAYVWVYGNELELQDTAGYGWPTGRQCLFASDYSQGIWISETAAGEAVLNPVQDKVCLPSGDHYLKSLAWDGGSFWFIDEETISACRTVAGMTLCDYDHNIILARMDKNGTILFSKELSDIDVSFLQDDDQSGECSVVDQAIACDGEYLWLIAQSGGYYLIKARIDDLKIVGYGALPVLPDSLCWANGYLWAGKGSSVYQLQID